MKHCNEIAYLRQLCCLGLGKDIVIPEFLKAVQSVIPSGNNFFTCTNQNGAPVNCLTEMFVPNLQELATEILPRFFTQEKRSHVYSYFGCYPAITDHNVLDERFFQTDLYNLMWHPWALHHFILAPVIVNRRIVGLFFMFRPPEVQPFSTSDQALCLQLLPYIAHALQERSVKETDYVHSGQSSMVLTDKQGTIVHLNASAKRLLSLAINERGFNGRTQSSNPVLPSVALSICAKILMPYLKVKKCRRLF